MLDRRHERAFFHSALSFLHRRRDLLAERFLQRLGAAVEEGAVRRFGDEASVYVRQLDWDTEFFGHPVYRIEFSDWSTAESSAIDALGSTLCAFLDDLAAHHPHFYVFAEVPSEDLVMLQGMGTSGFRLIETRLTYFRDDLQRFSWPRRSAVRDATEDDIADLRSVAADTRNLYDRFHADPFFAPEVADAFLAMFAENSVKGLADVVLVPAEGQATAGAFLTGNLMPALDADAGMKTARMVLSAVSEARRGWYLRLIAELSYWFQERGIQLAYMSTQATNRAVIHVWEKLGYGFGRASHVLAAHRGKQ
jgi:dTDP-4-amino-4,6-dideoxy-D-galactose acyltransferase